MADYDDVPCGRCGRRRQARDKGLLCKCCRSGDPAYLRMTDMLLPQQRSALADVDWDEEIARWRVDHPLPKPSTIM